MTANPERKPNLIFDVTMKNLRKLEEITRNVKNVGYDPKNVHIVWVINDVDIAIQQNQSRDRVVPEDILMDTHEGVARTMNKLVSGAVDISQYMDGQITFVFNNAKIDTSVAQSGKGGKYVEDFLYINAKERGKKPIPLSKFQDVILKKIESYVPKMDYRWKK